MEAKTVHQHSTSSHSTPPGCDPRPPQGSAGLKADPPNVIVILLSGDQRRKPTPKPHQVRGTGLGDRDLGGARRGEVWGTGTRPSPGRGTCPCLAAASTAPSETQAERPLCILTCQSPIGRLPSPTPSRGRPAGPSWPGRACSLNRTAVRAPCSTRSGGSPTLQRRQGLGASEPFFSLLPLPAW